MNLLLVAATKLEIEPFLTEMGFKEGSNQYQNHQITILITGVGMVATAFSLGQKLISAKYDFAINIGIAGSFDKNIPLGQLVQITADTFAELGAEDGDNFISIDELGFGKQAELENPLPIFSNLNFKKLKGITVNRVHGNEKSIEKIISQTQAQVESMEGAAFFYACNQIGLPCIQVRAISNYVERRNRDSWEIGLAIKNLCEMLKALLLRLA